VAEIQSHLKEALAILGADRLRIEDWLTQHSEDERQRISDAYDSILAALRSQYPHLPSTNVA
jgi:hypothetical protein